MKKVVLLAGALAAGMAAAPVTANAAPTLPDVQKVQDLTPDQTHTMMHGEIDVTAHNLGAEYNEIVKQINDPSYDGKYKDYDAAALASMKTALENGPIKALDDANTALETAYADWKLSGDDDAFNTAVGAITYPSQDDVDGVLEAMASFDADVKAWKEYNEWLNGDTDVDNVSETGVSDLHYKLTTGINYQHVDEADDVVTAEGNYASAKTAFTSALGAMPVAGLDGVSSNEVVKNASTIDAAQAALSNGTNGAYEALNNLVTLYHNDQAALLAGDYADYIAEDAAAGADYKNKDNAFSTGYTAAVAAAQTAAKDYIETFDAADAATWRTGYTGEGANFTNEAGYKSGAEAKVTALGTVIGNAKANVEAYDQLKSVLDQAATDIAALRSTYWDKRKDGTAGSNLVTPADNRYVYRNLIKSLESNQSLAETALATAFNTADPSTDATSILGAGTAEEAYATLLQSVSDAQTNWAANETAHTTAQSYLGTHTLSLILNTVQWDDDSSSLLGERKDVTDVIDAYANVKVWNGTAYTTKGVNTSDYNADFTCDHDKPVVGLTNLQTMFNNARNGHVDAYNNITEATWVASNLVNAEGNRVGVAKAFGDNLPLIANQAATDQANLLMERVKGELVQAKDKMEALDLQCHEARACDDADCGDAQANPCGWHKTATAALLDAIENATTGTIKAQEDVIDAKHEGETAVADDIVALTTTFMNTVLGAGYDDNFDHLAGTLGAWVDSFKDADKDHNDKLDDTKAKVDNAIHKNIHEVIGVMRLDAANFETGDTKAADLWAQALTGLDLNLDGAADTFADFKTFVDALEAAEAIYTAKAQELYDKHFWTQLDALLKKIVGEGGLVEKCTYKQAVDTNRTARIALETQLAEKKAELEAAINTVDALKVYSTTTNMGGEVNDYLTLTDEVVVDDVYDTAIKKANKALADEAKAIADAHEHGKAGSYVEGGEVKEGYKFKDTDINAAIAAYVAAVHAAEAKYQANHEAYQALEAALTEFDGVVKLAEKAAQEAKLGGALYTVAIDGDNNDATDVDAKMALLRVDTAADAVTIDSEHGHYLEGFKKATLAGDKATELTHLATLQTKLDAAEEALLAATAFKAKNVAGYNTLNDKFNNAATDLKVLVDEAAAADVYEVDGHMDATAIKAAIAKAQTEEFGPAQEALEDALAKGQVVAKYDTLDEQVDALSDVVTALRTLLAEKVKFFEAEHAAAADYSEQVNNLKVLLGSVDTWACYDDVDINDHDFKALDALYQEINKAIEDEETAISTDLTAGNVQAHATAHETAIENIDSRIYDLQHAVSEAEKFYADEHALAADYDKQVADLEVLQQSLDTTWAVYDDIDNDKDAAALSAAYQAIREAIATERAAIATDLKLGHVQAHAEDYEVAGETVKGHETVIGDINDAIKTLQDNVKLFEQFYADEHALADKYNDELNNLETLRDALGTVWDAYETLDDSDQTLKVLHEDWQAITEDIAAERTAIATDLEAGHVQAHAADYEEAGETVKGHETVLSDISDAIKTLQDKVRGIEEFKATNDKNYATLVEATKDLLASLDDVKYVSDDVYELLPATEAAADLDQESIEAAREAAKTLATTELTALETALAAGHLYSDSEVAAQQAKIDEVADALEALKEQVKAAEDFRRANAEANDKLEEKVQTLVTIINTAKANSVCDLCNDEDTADLEAELDAVYEILGNVAESFAVGHLAMPMVTDNYAKYMQDLGAVEADVQTTLDEIAEHKVRQINDQNAYNVLQKALTDVDLWLANVQLEEGWENFAVRTDHCSNKTEGLKYLNELTDDVNDLKALIETQHSHAGGHVCEENKIDDMKAMKVLIEDAKTLIAAIQANEAAKVILDAQFEEVAGLVNDALEFWEDNYMDKTLVQLEDIIAYWTGTPVEKGQLQKMYDLIQDKYQHGAAAYDWTVDAKGEEFKQDVIDDVEKQKQDIEMHRNTAANYEAINHMDEVEAAIDALVAEVKADVTEGDMVDPFVKELYADFLELVGEYAVDNEGLYGVLAQIDATRNENYLAGTLEDAINIDERSKIKGIHQMLDELKANAETLVATYNDLFEHAHHLTNGKTLYSDMQYVTIGFFRHANEGLGEQATEMFKVVEPHFDAVAGNIGIYDTNWLNVLDWEDVNDTPDNWFDDVPAAYERDFAGHLVHQDGLGEIPAKVGVLGHGDKKNELTFTLNDEQDYENAEIRTLAAGAADITFKPGSLTVDGWTTKHNVYIEVNVEAPQVETVDAPVATGSNKLIVRLDNPIDLTYTNNSLVARTNDGTEFSYADRVINYAAGQLEFILPEGTQTVELPEGFFTFRTGENTIARSAAMTVAIGTATSIEGLIAMGEKVQIFDLQGRRVKAEALISGNTYVVNGEKVMVK